MLRNFLCILGLVVFMAGCRGQKTEKRPFHPNPNMDDVARYNPQAPSDMFANGKAGRPRIDGTVSRDDKFELDPVRQGKDANGEYLTYIPMQVKRILISIVAYVMVLMGLEKVWLSREAIEFYLQIFIRIALEILQMVIFTT